MATRGPTAGTDYGHTPHAERARQEKACALEHHAFVRGYKKEDVARDDVREELLGDLAKERGVTRSKVSASLDTWREVWRLLRDREQLGGRVVNDPFSDAVHDPFSDAVHDPFGGAR